LAEILSVILENILKSFSKILAENIGSKFGFISSQAPQKSTENLTENQN